MIKNILAFFISVFCLASQSMGLTIASYNPARHDRFSSGYGTSNPVPNSSENFIGKGYDWSGVGWQSDVPNRSVTLVSPMHFVAADHYRVPEGSNISFLNRDNQLKTYKVLKYSTFSYCIDGYSEAIIIPDLVLGWLTEEIPESDHISYYSVLHSTGLTKWFDNKETFMYGANARIGINKIAENQYSFRGGSLGPYPHHDTRCFLQRFNSEQADSSLGVDGDSGSPSLLAYNGQLAVVGTHYLSDQVQSTYDSFIPHYIESINNAMAPSGHQLKLIYVPSNLLKNGDIELWGMNPPYYWNMVIQISDGIFGYDGYDNAHFRSGIQSLIIRDDITTAGNHSHDTYITQTINTNIGNKYAFSFWYYNSLEVASNALAPSVSVVIQAGIDPSGGTDPNSSNIIWTTITPDNEQLNYRSWENIVVKAMSTGPSMTVFMRRTLSGSITSDDIEAGKSWISNTYIDDAELIMLDPSIPNHAPSLNWINEDNYISDGLNPETGSSDTIYTFKVKYIDEDNDSPVTGYPKVHILSDSNEISGSPFIMSEIDVADTNYIDGKIFQFPKNLPYIDGVYSYYFEAKDSFNLNAAGIPTNVIIDKPHIQPSLLLAPTSFDGQVLSTGSIRWTWLDNSTNETGFKVKSVDVVLKTLPQNAVSWVEDGLQPNTQYTRYVLSYNASGESSGSSIISKYTLANVPTGLSKTVVHITSGTIQWNDVGASKYSVERTTGSDGIGTWQTVDNNITNTSYTDTNLSAGTTYYYRVKSYNVEGVINPNPSSIKSILTSMPILPPSLPLAPTSFNGAVLSTGSIRWTWLDNSTNETGFKVKSVDVVLKTLPQNAVNWVEGGLQPNTQYTRYVVSYNASGESSGSSIISKYTLANVPTGLSKTVVHITSGTIQWNDVGASKYSVERTTGSDGIGTWQTVDNNITNTSYTDTNLSAGTTYYYRVKSYNVEGVINPNPSSIKSILTSMPILPPSLPLAPTSFDGQVLSTGSIRWTWLDNSTNETGFKVKSVDVVLKTLPQNAVSWVEGGLQPNTQYTRYVVSYNDNGDSSQSNIGSQYTLAAPIELRESDFKIYYSSVTIELPSLDDSTYLIERANDNNGSPSDWLKIKDWNDNIKNNFTDIGLSQNTHYHYRVKSYNKKGVLNDTPSNVINILTLNSNIKQVMIDNQIGGTISLHSAKLDANVIVVPNTFGNNLILTVSTTSISQYNSGLFIIPSINLALEITAENNQQPNKEITIVIYYKDSNIVGIDENKLIICRYDSSTSKLVPLTSKVYPDINKIEAKTTHLSKFVVCIPVIKDDLSSIKIYPNPYNLNMNLAGLTFENLPEETRIKIYTISAELIKTVDCSSNNGTAKWDGTNEANKKVASGVYIALLKTPKETKKLKIAIIR